MSERRQERIEICRLLAASERLIRLIRNFEKITYGQSIEANVRPLGVKCLERTTETRRVS